MNIEANIYVYLLKLYPFPLTLLALQQVIFENSVDLDQTNRNKPFHQDLHYYHSFWFLTGIPICNSRHVQI